MVRRMDSHRIGVMRIGYSRIGVLNPVFERMIVAGITREVTRKRRDVSVTYDPVTGQPDVSWTDFTIDARIQLGPSLMDESEVGFIGHLDGMITTADPIKLLDRIVDGAVTYEINQPMQEKKGRYDGFLLRRAGLKKLDLT